MKKFLTILLLSVFCAVQTTIAGEVVIVGTDGQARYEDKNTMSESYSKTTKQSQSDVLPINKRDILYKKYDSQFRKYLRKKKHSMSFKITDDYILTIEQTGRNEDRQCSYKFGKDTETLKIKLKDGDYAVLHENSWVGYKYAVEYHKDGTIMGLVDFDLVNNTKSEAVAVFYEYRILNDKLVLKHTFCLNINKDENSIVQFIYDEDRNVKCYQINDKIYCADGDNLIIETDGFYIRDYTYEENKNIKMNKAFDFIYSNPITGISIGLPLFIIITFPPIRTKIGW